MYILGISAFYHDSAACLVKDGEILSAAQEERFTRKKHDHNFPQKAIEFCLKDAGITAEQLDLVSFYDKPFLKFERLLETYLAFAPVGIKSFIKAMPLWIKEKLWMKEMIKDKLGYTGMKEMIKDKLGYTGKVIFPEHHESHAASAFYPSPYNKAAILTMDGVGEWTTTSYGIGDGNDVQLLADIKFPHSLGLLYSAITYYTGFKVNSGEYKVMGLAPYGEPKYKQLIYDHLIDVKEDGSFRMHMEYFNYCQGLTMTNEKFNKLYMEYFNYCQGLTMTNEKFNKLFGGPPREPETNLTQKEMDLARSLQEVTEEIVLKLGNHVYKETGLKNLCLAGGVALNCVANGRLLREGPFENIWIQPAAGDAGGALGAALIGWYKYHNNPRIADEKTDSQKGSYLGPVFNDDEIHSFIQSYNLTATKYNDDELIKNVANLISSEKVIGWFDGKMEFGPRALGSRTILGDARSPKMQATMNIKIKFREGFRPFAPSVLYEKVNEYFETEKESPYMLFVADVKKERRIPMTDDEQKKWGIDKLNVVRSDIPTITHVDYSARLQTVHKETNPRYHKLISQFEKNTACAVIINTSFNIRGEPIVCTPADAYKCFMRTDMDYLVLGNYILSKADQKPLENDSDWKKEFVLD